ncbi:glycoside hydrolase family 1 protein [Croceicoccus sediminis]|uniref:glycoside hydrolase family 1 protein n=1 Tax=Croceicoccus sediminis TaxID=2571150 RepID=UPI001182E09B|nr:family 1 glycosylhydrolase [Croceicoccus sediminis]
MHRRSFLGAGALAIGATAAPAFARGTQRHGFPEDFVWGSATSGHQTEGNNIASDQWLFETVEPRLAKTPSGDACNSFELWPKDLDLIRGANLSSYRFSIEWPRIEPVKGEFSIAMLDHYRRMLEGCRARGITPMVTLCHFTTPRWFAASGGFKQPDAPALFARYCTRVMEHMGDLVSNVVTINEANVCNLLAISLPDGFFQAVRATLNIAARQSGSDQFVLSNLVLAEDLDAVTTGLLAGHAAGREAIRAAAPHAKVGVTVAVNDDQAARGGKGKRDAIREQAYGQWLRAVADDDFIGVQNYHRKIWGAEGKREGPEGAPVNFSGEEVYAPSLANAVRYVHDVTGKPIYVTEHGVGTSDDAIRQALIPAALRDLRKAIADGVPVRGYYHWSLLDNYEWGGEPENRFGLVAVNRKTFERTPKPSYAILAAIAQSNGRDL